MPASKATWFEFYRLDQNGRTDVGVVAYDGSTPIQTLVGIDKRAIIDFLESFPDAKTCQVAPSNKGFPQIPRPPVPQPDVTKCLKCVRTNVVEGGLEKLLLTIEGTNKSWYVNSGVAGKQVFQLGGTGELPGTLYPAPEGTYAVSDIQWADGKDNYDASHGEGLGPVFVPFDPVFTTRRGAFGFHWDANRDTSPGSAGCMVFKTVAELKDFVAALREFNPRTFIIDWGIAKAKPEPKPEPVTAWKPVKHSYKGGEAIVEIDPAKNLLRIVADADTDADGSPRAKSIDPGNGQLQTSLGSHTGWKGKGAVQGDETYVDSEQIPYFVLPGNFLATLGGAGLPNETPRLGCIARISWKDKRVFGILADYGPTDIIGEASIRVMKELGFDCWNADKTKVVRGIPNGVTYEIAYDKADLNRCVDFASIQAYGAEVFGVVPTPEPKPDTFVELKVGSSGNAVEALQSQLNRVFTNVVLVEDGKFGPLTRDAVVLFQELTKLPKTGIVNKATWDALVAAKSESLSKPDVIVQPGKKTLIVPWATQVAPFKTSWTYPDGYPKGLVVHFTATGPTAAQEKGVENYMRANWSVWMMKRSGELLQTFPLNKGGYHCGTWHHDVCLGVEIVAAGRCKAVQLDGVTKYAPWYAYNEDGALVHPEYCFTAAEMRYSGPNKIRNIYPGWYQKYTAAQEENLIKLCLWLKEQAPDLFNFDLVVGHDEACDVGGRPGAKNDPGAALSMDMPALREKLKMLWAARG